MKQPYLHHYSRRSIRSRLRPFRVCLRQTAGLCGLALALAATSCTPHEDLPTGKQPEALTLHAAVDAPVTRVSGTQWDKGDRIGVTVDVGGKMHYNLSFVTGEGDGFFTPEASEPLRIVPSPGTPMRVTASYPFKGSPGVSNPNASYEYRFTAANQKDAASREKIDFLFAEFSSTLPTSSVHLTFRHSMARVVFNFRAGEGIDGLGDVTCILDGVCRGTFSPLTGKAVATGTVADKLELFIPAEVATAECILFPQPANATAFYFQVMMKGRIFTFMRDFAGRDFKPLQAGYTYLFNVFFDKNSVVVTTFTTGEWTDGGEKQIESTPTN